MNHHGAHHNTGSNLGEHDTSSLPLPANVVAREHRRRNRVCEQESPAVSAERGQQDGWPTRDEIIHAVKNLWAVDPSQYTEITTRVLGEVRNVRAWKTRIQ